MIALSLVFNALSFFELFLLFYVLLDTFKLVLKSSQKLRITVVKELAVLVFLLHAIEPDLVWICACALLSHNLIYN